jgi:hypothetical protein
MSNVRPYNGPNKLSLSSYWGSPIPGGYSRVTLELIALGRFEAEAGKGEGNEANKKEFDQLSIPCDNKFVSVSYPDHLDLWGKFSDEWHRGKKTP